MQSKAAGPARRALACVLAAILFLSAAPPLTVRALDYGPVPAEPGNRGQKNYENLLLTGTFESGTDGWTLDEGAALSSEQYRNGGQSLKLEGAEAVFVDSPVVTLSPYRNYVVQAWVYKSAPDDAFALSFASGTRYRTAVLPESAQAGQWHLVALDFSSLAETGGRLIMRATGAVYVDDAEVFLLSAGAGEAKVYANDLTYTVTGNDGGNPRQLPNDESVYPGGGERFGYIRDVFYDYGIACHPDNSAQYPDNIVRITFDVAGKGYTSFSSYVGRSNMVENLDRTIRPKLEITTPSGTQTVADAGSLDASLHGYFDVDIPADATSLTLVVDPDGDLLSDLTTWGDAVFYQGRVTDPGERLSRPTDSPIAGDGLKTNGSFENGATGWGLSAGASVSQERASLGDFALRMSGASSQALGYADGLDKYCYYVLSGWVYREAADDVASVSVRDGMWELDFSGEDGVGQWKYFMLDFANYNEAAVTARLTAQAESGAVWFDGLEVTKLSRALNNGNPKDYLVDLSYDPVDTNNNDGPAGRYPTDAGLEDIRASIGREGSANYTVYESALIQHPSGGGPGYVIYDLTGKDYTRFTSYVGRGNPDSPGDAKIIANVYLDYGGGFELVKTSGPLTITDISLLDMDVTGASRMKLEVTDGGDGISFDSTVWGDPQLAYALDEGAVFFTVPTQSAAAGQVFVSDSLDVAGYAVADSVKIYVNDAFVQEITLEGVTWETRLTGLTQRYNTVRVESWVGGEPAGSDTRTIDRGGEVVNVSDAVWASANAEFGTPYRNTADMSRPLSIGGGALVSTNGFQTHPLAGPVDESYADVVVDVSGSGMSYFQSYVGLYDGRGDTRGSVEFIVLSKTGGNETVLARSGAMYDGQMRRIAADIPADAQYLILRVTNYDGDYSFCASSWCEPVLAKSVESLYKHTVPMYDGTAASESVPVDGLQTQFVANAPFRRLILEPDAAPSGEVTVRLYKWLYSYDRTMNASPVCSAAFVQTDAGAYVADLMKEIPAGEYLMELSGPGAVLRYACENQSIVYTSDADAPTLEAAPKMQVIFSATADPFFGAASGSASSYTKISNEASESETATVEAAYREFIFEDMSKAPISFNVGGKAYTGFDLSGDFVKVSQQTEVNELYGGREETTTVLTHTPSGLTFELLSTYYPGYAGYDLTLYIKNETENVSPVVKDLKIVDMRLSGDDAFLYYTGGDQARFSPSDRFLDGQNLVLAPSGGRSSNGVFPYFNLEYGGGGVLFAVGWPGQWQAGFDNTARSSTRLTMGQQNFESVLEPGETARTPLAAFIFYEGRNADRATNLWRRWFLDCFFTKVEDGEDGYKLFDPVASGGTSNQWAETTRATDDNQIAAMDVYLDNGVDLDYWWMDAGWYYAMNGDDGEYFLIEQGGGWTRTGVWQVDQDRFPTKMQAIGDHIHENGMKFMVWFEPERVGDTGLSTYKTDAAGNRDDENGTYRAVNRDWVIPGTNLVNMGIDEAADWVTERVKEIMDTAGIDTYREDFNTDPYGAWVIQDELETAAAADPGYRRNGITENKYVQGHLRFWDSILEEYPESVIDSCASGGLRNDLETMRRAVPLHRTDFDYSNNSIQQGYNFAMASWIPYFGCKSDWNGYSSVSANKASFRRSVVAPWMVMGLDGNEITDWDHIAEMVDEHADVSRFIYDDYYQLTPFSNGDNAWLAWEYYSEDKGEGYAVFFRRAATEATQTIKLKGLDPDKMYHLWFEDRGDYRYLSGLSLMRDGLQVSLPASETSDILHILDASQNSYTARALETAMTQVAHNGQRRGAIAIVPEAEGARASMPRTDLRLNMTMSDQLRAAGEGKMLYGVQEQFADTLLINGVSVGELLAADADSVIVDVDLEYNFLNIYADSLDPDDINTVTLAAGFENWEGVRVTGETIFAYSPAQGATPARWVKTTAPGELTPVASVTISGSSARTLVKGEQDQLEAQVGGEDATVQGLYWYSSAPGVVSVDQTGLVTAHAPGEAVIYAMAKDGSGVSAQVAYTVTETQLYALTVEGGAGGGRYAEGAKVKIAADPAPDGMVFDGWTSDNGGRFAAASDPETEFTMPAGDVTVTANYRSAGRQYTVTVTASPASGGSVIGGGSFAENASRTVTAQANEGYEFVRWTENGVQVSDRSVYAFTLTGNRSLVAEFRAADVPDYSERTLSDTHTGVTVTGEMTADAALSVTQSQLHPAGACAACDELRAQNAAGELVLLLDISVSGGYRGDMAVSIPVGAQYDGETVAVLCCVDGALAQKSACVKDGVVSISLGSLGVVAVAKPGVTPVPDTGDTGAPLVWAAAAAAAAGGAVVLTAARVRRRRQGFGN